MAPSKELAFDRNLARLLVVDSDSYAEITIDGRLHVFSTSKSGVEFETADFSIRNAKIMSCMVALRDASRPLRAEDSGTAYLTVRLEEEKLPWEKILLGAYFDSEASNVCNVEFILNTAIGSQEETLSGIISSLLLNSDYSLRAIHHSDDIIMFEEDGWHSWSVQLSCLSDRATFGDFFKLRRLLSQSVFLPSELITTPYLALRVVQLGQASTLVGHEESEWLEAKSTPYEYKAGQDSAWKLELAKDVAQFANSGGGGLLVIGLHTKRVNGADTIDRVTQFPYNDSRVQSYRDVLRYRIHPPLTGIQLDAVKDENLCVLYIFVPPQPEENKPYLVIGSLIDGVYEKLGITIVRRNGDASIPVTAYELHSMIVAGRAFLRGQAKQE
jgi:hypothetical protein